MLEIGKDVTIEEGAYIKVKHGFIGDRSIIRSGAHIEGTSVELGVESYLDHGAVIGGGSCWDSEASLKTGCWLHMGWNSQLNIARGIVIGEQVGIGIETKIFTHGAYLPLDQGFPTEWGSVLIGDNVWLPNAWVNPGVVIGDNVVVAARSLINTELPAGCFAAGTPAVVIKEHAYPVFMAADVVKKKLDKVLFGLDAIVASQDGLVRVFSDAAIFMVTERRVQGFATCESELVRNQLRRNGIRFKYHTAKGEYKLW